MALSLCSRGLSIPQILLHRPTLPTWPSSASSQANFSSQTRRQCECCMQCTRVIWFEVFIRPKQDARCLNSACLYLYRLAFLQKHTAEYIINLREESWQPLIYYRASLLAAAEGEDALSYVSSDRKPCLPHRSNYSKQKLDGTALQNTKLSIMSPNTSCINCICVFRL